MKVEQYYIKNTKKKLYSVKIIKEKTYKNNVKLNYNNRQL